MTVKQMLLFGAVMALEVKTTQQKMTAPDDDEYDFAEDDDDDPADFSVGQFLSDEDDDSFLQTKTRNLREDEEEHYFNTFEGEDEADDDEDNTLPGTQYDDAYVQLALSTHAAASKAKLLQKEKAPDDEDYDFAEDDDDDPADFSVGQFLDDDDDAFIQLKTRSGDDDDDYADDRIGAGEYVSLSDAMETKAMAAHGDEDEEESGDDTDDAMNEVFLQEARKHVRKHHQNHKNHKQSIIALEHKKALLKHSLLGVTDVYKQLAIDEAHGKVGEEAGWMPADDEDSDEGASFLQTNADTEEEGSASDDDDDENGLADDRLDGGMDQILAATAESNE